MFSNTHMATQRLRTCLFGSVLALAATATVSPAFASSPYDGNWSVVITTQRGACEPTVRYGVQIVNGTVLNTAGGAADVRGQVGPRGNVNVMVRSGSAWAVGAGRLSRAAGGGSWRGEGSSGACGGSWVAQRAAGEAANPGGPVYNYAPGVGAPGAPRPEMGACERFRSYNPATGTYLGYDGMQHPCP
jgi:BA14K-like protein